MKISLLTLFMLASLSAQASHHYGSKYKLTLKNNHPHQSFSPALIVLHKSRFKLFKENEPASESFASFAEDGDLSGLSAELDDSRSQVESHLSNGKLIAPGETVSVIIETKKPSAVRLSVITMAATSHDVFGAFDALSLPSEGSQTSFASFFDAGTEKDTENCKFIPGPPCGNMNVRDPDNGVITPFNGFKGGVEIDPSLYNLLDNSLELVVEKIK